MSGLYLITLPIGDFDDITLKALDNLKSLDIFYAEDTRVFKDYLSHYKIEYSQYIIDSFHDHSESKINKIIELIKSGKKVGLVSDAGSPVISDPAYPLLKKAIEEGLDVFNASGITSVICALELSGLPTNPFHYWGFIGRSESEKREFFKNCQSIKGTHIFFESPHRIFDTVENFFKNFEFETLIVTRELTKKFQSVYRFTKNDIPSLKEKLIDKGEFVLLFYNDSAGKSVVDDNLRNEVEDYLNNGGNTKKLAKIFSKITGSDTKTIYNQMTQVKKS